MAVKGELKDRETQSEHIYTLLQGMRGIMQSNGGKPGKIPKPQPLIKTPESLETPKLLDVLQAFGGSGTEVIQQ